MAAEWQILRSRNLSSGVIATLQASRRASTNHIYNSIWASFCGWCIWQNLVPMEASTEQVLEFLQTGLMSGLSPNTLWRQVAALSSVLSCGSLEYLSRIPLIRQFLKGATDLSPPALHRYPTWDLPKVLTALTRGPFETLREVVYVTLPTKWPFWSPSPRPAKSLSWLPSLPGPTYVFFMLTGWSYAWILRFS